MFLRSKEWLFVTFYTIMHTFLEPTNQIPKPNVVKSLAINNQKDIENAIAEIFYVQVSNYFIKDRASKSLLLSQNKIVGLASQGLKDF